MATLASEMELIWFQSLFFTGFGLSFNLWPSLTITGMYFPARRPLAHGFAAMAEGAVFLCALGPLNQQCFIRLSLSWLPEQI